MNLREMQSSQDDHFLQNLGGSNDLFQEYCKIQAPYEQNMSDIPIKEQMDEQNYQIYAKKQEDSEKYNKKNSKEKKKVFYRDKMAGLLKPGEYVKQQYKYFSTSSLHQQNKPVNSREEQLKRNRESAKNSRQRKKQYVFVLEKKNEEQNRIITELTIKLQQVTLQRDRLKEDNHAQLKNFCKSKALAFQNLEIAIKQQKYTDFDVEVLLNDMTERFGAAGSERKELINYYMNEIIQDLVSDIHKYFLVSSSFVPKNVPNFSPKPLDLDVMRILRLDPSNLSSIVAKFKDRFTKETTVFKDLTQQFYRIFKSIEAQGKVIQLVFTQMMKEINPKAMAQLIVWFQQNRFCRQVKRVRSEWIEQLKTGEQMIEVIRKQTKYQNY